MSKENEFQELTLEEVFAEAPPCAQTTNVIRYHEDLLNEPERLTFEKHLKECFPCAQALIQVHRAAEAGDEVALDPDKSRKIFEESRLRLRAHLDAVYDRSKIQKVVPGPGRPAYFHFPPYLNAILLVVIAALIYPAYRGFVWEQQIDILQQRPTQEVIEQMKRDSEKRIQEFNAEKQKLVEPEVSGTNIYSIRPERDGKSDLIEIQFDGSQNIFPLTFALPAVDFGSYEVGVFRSGKIVWQTSYSPPTAHGLLSIQFKRGYFENGTYLLRLEGKGEKGISLLAEYTLRISQ